MNISLSDARLIFNTPKGTLMIVAFDSASSKPYEELVDRTLKENAKQGFRRDGEPYYMLHKKDIPLDNEKGQHFREALTYDASSNTCSFPIEKAKSAHLKRLQSVVRKKLTALRAREDVGEILEDQISMMKKALSGFDMNGISDIDTLYEAVPTLLKD